MIEFGDLPDSLQKMITGLGVTLPAALMGRIIWHSQEARKRNRKFWSWMLLLEAVIAIFCGIVGSGIAEYLDLKAHATAAVAGVAGYIGPRGIEAALIRIASAKGG